MQWLESILAGLGKLFGNIAVERIRRTLALLPLGFFFIQLLFLGLLIGPPMAAPLLGLAICYLIAFIGLGSEWFWARWYAKGLGWWGFMIGAMSIMLQGPEMPFIIMAGLHASVVVLLYGSKMAKLYDGREDWREHYGLDEHGAKRVGKAVTRIAGSLPLLVLWALGPREGDFEYLASGGHAHFWSLSATVVVPLVVGLGLYLLLKARSIGVLVLFGGALLGVGGALIRPISGHGHAVASGAFGAGWMVPGIGVVGAMLVLFALVPFARPVAAYLRARS